MPYIKNEDRGKYNSYIKSITNMINKLPKDTKSGHLNYVITKLILMTNPNRYDDYNSLIGVLECAKMELNRRRIAPYEDTKIADYGDVY